MKKILLLIIIISNTVFGQKKVGNDVFKIEFLRIMTNLNGSSNDYYTDLAERSMFSKKHSLKYQLRKVSRLSATKKSIK